MLFRSYHAAVALALVLAPAAAYGQDARPVQEARPAPSYPAAAPLLSTGTTVVDEPIRYPTKGAPRITAAILTIAPGEKTVAHTHGVPLFAYIMEGELTVDYGDKGKRTYRQGDAFMEAMSVEHFGSNTGTRPVRLLAVYMGAEGAADVIPAK